MGAMMEFKEFPKMARLSRECIITEKLDGTNAQIYIVGEDDPDYDPALATHIVGGYALLVGSRTRWIKPGDDNYGFAAWVKQNADELVKLGIGQHFGEWWGKGIQRGYGVSDKRFSLFNTTRWNKENVPGCVSVVPELYRGLFDTITVDGWIQNLKLEGSIAAPGFMKPEGIVIYHVAAGIGFKKTIEKDEQPKGKSGS